MKTIIRSFILLISVSVFMAFASAEDVVFVSDLGSDTAAGTAEAPLQTLTAAYARVGGAGGTVVLCGKLSLKDDALHFPVSDGEVTLTSTYEGVDYYKTDNATLDLYGYTYLNGDTVLENLVIWDYSSFYFNQLICHGHNFTVGDGVVCKHDNSHEYMTIVGGEYIKDNSVSADSVSFYDYTITINSGTWLMLNASNRRTSNTSPMGATGNVRVVINGGGFSGDPTKSGQADSMICVGGFASQNGDYELEINGGRFHCPIYGIGRAGDNSGRYTAYYDGDVRIKITGGEFFHDTVKTVQSEATSYIGGDYTLEITGGTFTDLKTVSAARVRGTAAAILLGGTADAASDFDVIGDISVNAKTDKTVCLTAEPGVVFAGGNVDGDGKTSLTPMASLADAVAALGEAGGTIVICDKLYVKDVALPTYQKLIFTSVYQGTDFRTVNGAQLRLSSSLLLGGETAFVSMALESRNLSAYIFCNGYATTFGKDLVCTRHMDGGVTDFITIYTGSRLQNSTAADLGLRPAEITVESGEWNFLRCGNERTVGGANTLRTVVGDSAINITGGVFHGDVCGTGKNNQDGKITMRISGGTFLCSVYGMHTPANVDNDVSTVNGDITISITGGEFHGDIQPVQNDEKNAINGKYTLVLAGGDLRCVGAIKGTQKVQGTNTSELLTDFDLEAKVGGTITYQNPILGYGADPSVYYHDGWYYYARTSTVGGMPTVTLSRAANLSDIGCSTVRTVYRSDTLGSIWAPQIYCFDGTWYIYFSGAESSASSAQRAPYVLKSDTSDPLGSYTMLGKLGNLDPNVYSWLSPRIFEYGGERYYITSVFETANDLTTIRHKQNLMIGKLSSPTSLAGSLSRIAVPDRDWERNDVMEGPYPVYGEDGAFYIAYAANYAHLDDYCTGLLKLVGTDLLSADSWEKQPEPMQARDNQNRIFAPGATVFTETPDGVYAVYHAKLHAQNQYNRSIFLQKLEYKDGVPYLGAPPSIDTDLTLPIHPISLAARISEFGGSETTVKLVIGNAVGYINGTAYSLDAAPVIRNDRTMLPVRFLAEAFGAQVGWDGATSTATVTADGVDIAITIGAETAQINGQSVVLDSPAFIENSRTYLPVRVIADALGASVDWDGATATATLKK